ncbi:MAG: hypothetical protein ISP90_12720 [Nevskia sp.]|nr:hypothetical protein [Nevskia sp.]
MIASIARLICQALAIMGFLFLCRANAREILTACSEDVGQGLVELVKRRAWKPAFYQATAIKNNGCTNLAGSQLVFAKGLIDNTQEVSDYFNVSLAQIASLAVAILNEHHQPCLDNKCPIGRRAFFLLEGRAYQEEQNSKFAVKSFELGDASSLAPEGEDNRRTLFAYARALGESGRYESANAVVNKLSSGFEDDVSVLGIKVFVDALEKNGKSTFLEFARSKYGFVDLVELNACEAEDVVNSLVEARACYSRLLDDGRFRNPALISYVKKKRAAVEWRIGH